MEICKFTPDEIYEAIDGLDELQKIIVPFFLRTNYEGKGNDDALQFQKHIKMAKHALIAMGQFMEDNHGQENT